MNVEIVGHDVPAFDGRVTGERRFKMPQKIGFIAGILAIFSKLYRILPAFAYEKTRLPWGEAREWGRSVWGTRRQGDVNA